MLVFPRTSLQSTLFPLFPPCLRCFQPIYVVSEHKRSPELWHFYVRVYPFFSLFCLARRATLQCGQRFVWVMWYLNARRCTKRGDRWNWAWVCRLCIRLDLSNAERSACCTLLFLVFTLAHKIAERKLPKVNQYHYKCCPCVPLHVFNVWVLLVNGDGQRHYSLGIPCIFVPQVHQTLPCTLQGRFDWNLWNIPLTHAASPLLCYAQIGVDGVCTVQPDKSGGPRERTFLAASR